MAAGHGLELIDGTVDCGLEGGDACPICSAATILARIIVVSLAGIEAVLFWEGVVAFVDVVSVEIICGATAIVASLSLLLLLL